MPMPYFTVKRASLGNKKRKYRNNSDEGAAKALDNMTLEGRLTLSAIFGLALSPRPERVQ
jgi:hypothetical protein